MAKTNKTNKAHARGGPAKKVEKLPPYVALADKVAQNLDADVLFYNAPIERHLDQRVIALCNHRKRRPNVAMFLVTEGGSADAAYRIASCLQRNYKAFHLFVPGYCKSAGTLIALGANFLVVSDNGENGPLDVQILRKDELVAGQSGLTATSSLSALNQEALGAWEEFLLRITKGAGPALSSKFVSDIAVKLTSALFAPIYQQIDPMHIGEAGRALEIARAYGHRLAVKGQNLKGDVADMLSHLIHHYPSHGHVIDRDEARKIFQRVRDFDTDETALMDYFGIAGRWPLEREDDHIVAFISTEIGAAASAAASSSKGKTNAQSKKPRPANRPRAGAGNPAPAQQPGAATVAQITDIERLARR